LSSKYTEAKLENQMLKGELENVTKNFTGATEEQRSHINENDSIKKRLDITEE
jgi:hypothetical protein